MPVYAAASWTNPVHTPGTFEAWEAVPDTVPKWLRIHNSQEWPDYYEDCNQKDLLRFFDRYLKDQKNDWETTPKVRLSVLHFGLVNQTDTVGRPEAEFPLARTQYTKLFLQRNNTLSLDPEAAESALSYDSQSEKQTFSYQFDKACETTGYFCAHLVMSCPEHTDMDVFVQVEKLSALKNPQAVQTIKPQNVVLQQLLKFMHDWNILPGGAGMAFHRGPSGCLRGSFALGRDEQHSRVYKPHYTYTEKISLKKGERRALDIPMSPSGMFWEVRHSMVQAGHEQTLTNVLIFIEGRSSSAYDTGQCGCPICFARVGDALDRQQGLARGSLRRGWRGKLAPVDANCAIIVVSDHPIYVQARKVERLNVATLAYHGRRWR